MKSIFKSYLTLTCVMAFLLFNLMSRGQNGVYYKTKSVKCKAAILKPHKDTVYVITQDTCTSPIFDTVFNGVYVFKKSPSNKPVAIRTFRNKMFDGQQIEYLESGQMWLKGFNKKNKRQGKWTAFYPTGEVNIITHYKNGKAKASHYFDKAGKEISITEHLGLMTK